MSDISKITLPNGTTYTLKDKWARDQIIAITGGNAVIFKGVSSTVLTDGGTESPNGDSSITVETGDLWFYGREEFIWGPKPTGSGGCWHSLGPQEGTLGALAYKNTATAAYTPQGTITGGTFTGSESSVTISTANNTNGNYTPAGSMSGGVFSGSPTTFTGSYTPQGSLNISTAGTVNKTATVSTISTSSSAPVTYTPSGTCGAPTISVATAGATTSVKEVKTITSVVTDIMAGVPSVSNTVTSPITYYSVVDEVLSLYQIGRSKDAPITTQDVTVKTGDASYSATTSALTGKGVRLVTGNIPVPNSFNSTFSGTPATISVNGTPNGSNTATTFSGTKVLISGKTTAAGGVSNIGFSGTATTIQVS